MSGRCDCHSIKTHRFEISNENLPKSRRTWKKLTKKMNKGKIIKRRNSSSSTTSAESFEIEYNDDSDATHFSEPNYDEEYLEEEYLDDVGNGENLNKDFALQKEKNERSVLEAKQERKSAAQKGVTILSDIRNLPCNKRYFDLKEFQGQQFRKLDPNFDLFAAKKSVDDVTISTENVDPYKNPVASTSGINKSSGLKNFKLADCSLKYLDLSTKEAKPDLITVKANKNEKTDDLEYKNETKKDIEINQNVLVRYYIRNRWKYYIGRVEEINITEDTYTVNFLKTVKNPSLKFVVTKKIDRDTVPSVSIVKPIELVTHHDKENEYLLCDNFDSTYFEVM